LGRGDQQIECDWFYGSVQEAAMEALERNNILKLNISQPDRMEEAWKWVLLEWGSKAEIGQSVRRGRRHGRNDAPCSQVGSVAGREVQAHAA
jgi:hypothetical protein